MDRRHLRYLIALADELNFSRAAARMGIAQPPFSKQIRDLETEIGADLFQRTTRDVSLTAAGIAFVERARHLERQLAEAVYEARQIAAGQLGKLRVGFTESGIFHPDMVRIFQKFRLTHPKVEFTLEEQVSTTLASMVQRGELDVAFTRPPLPTAPDLECMLLLSEGLAVALPLKHRLAKHKAVKLADLVEERFIFFPRQARPGLTGSVMSACAEAGFEPLLGQAAPQVTSAMRLVAVGAGIAVVPASLSHLMMDDLVMRPLDHPRLRAEIAFVCRRSDNSALTLSIKSIATMFRSAF